MEKINVKINSEFQKYKRVWRLLKRPSAEEFKMISKVSIVGLLIIDAMGFLISLFMNFIF